MAVTESTSSAILKGGEFLDSDLVERGFFDACEETLFLTVLLILANMSCSTGVVFYCVPIFKSLTVEAGAMSSEGQVA